MKIKIYLLGTGSGLPTWNRYAESIAVEIGDNIYLMDAGEPCSATMIRLGIKYDKVNAVFISHMDADHFSGLPMLVQTMDLSRQAGGTPLNILRQDGMALNIFTPPKVCEEVRRYLQMMYLIDEEPFLSFKLNIFPLAPGRVYEHAGTSFSAYPNNHVKLRFEMYPPQKGRSVPTDSFSFLITLPDKRRIGYTGDIAGVNDLDAFVNETDILLTEVGHVAPEKVFAYLADKNVGKIIALHSHPDWNDREEEMLSLGNKYLGDKVLIGNDGMTIDF